MICHASSKFERRKVVESSFSFPLKLLHELFVHCQGDTCLIESVGNFFRYHGLHVVDTCNRFELLNKHVSIYFLKRWRTTSPRTLLHISLHTIFSGLVVSVVDHESRGCGSRFKSTSRMKKKEKKCKPSKFSFEKDALFNAWVIPIGHTPR
uniref:Uncharacterized protein n=1 Tax=Cacopsylla melanoneura TaxID=428564 RepID=A0A8D9AID3_9HEMI